MSRLKPRRPGSAHAALALLMEQIGRTAGNADAGVRLAADFEGVRPPTLYTELNPDLPGEISFVRVARLTSHFGAPAAAQLLADLCGCLLVKLPKETAGDTLSQEAGESAQKFGQMMTDFGLALCDGSIHAREGAVLKADVDQLLMALYRFRQTVIEKTEADEVSLPGSGEP